MQHQLEGVSMPSAVGGTTLSNTGLNGSVNECTLKQVIVKKLDRPTFANGCRITKEKVKKMKASR